MWESTIKELDKIIKQPDELLTIRNTATAAEAAWKMSDNKVGCLVVLDAQDSFVGIVSERDMISKVLTTTLPPNRVFVKDIMTTDTISCTMDTTITKAEHLMDEHKIRHLPILENGVPRGMVSSRDIIAYLLQTNKAMKAAAEQLAMLSAGLKSLVLEDVIALAINEVPKSFGAEAAVLCLAKRGPYMPMVYRNQCPLSQEYLYDPDKIEELCGSDQATCGKICERCEKAGGRAPHLIISLSIHDQGEDGQDEDLRIQGFLCMCRFSPSSLTLENLQLYKASLLREVLNANLTNAALYQNYQKARHDSETDPLTGLRTRRALEDAMKIEYARAIRYRRPLSIAIVDIDNFKQINDNAGHSAGDKVLRQLAKTIRSNVRITDVVIARYGGDEFVLVLPETKLNNAADLLERLRIKVTTVSVPDVRPITISGGVAEWNASPEDTVKDIMKRADTALYEAKRTGRNRIVADRPASPAPA